jgi:hypothetical protein
VTARSYEMADDDLSRQRRKRDQRLLAQPIPGASDITVGDLVADVLAASADHRGTATRPELDVPGYLAERGHDWSTIKTVIDYVERHQLPGGHPAGSRSHDARGPGGKRGERDEHDRA